jgi:hypothetical protein
VNFFLFRPALRLAHKLNFSEERSSKRLQSEWTENYPHAPLLPQKRPEKGTEYHNGNISIRSCSCIEIGPSVIKGEAEKGHGTLFPISPVGRRRQKAGHNTEFNLFGKDKEINSLGFFP